MQSITNTQAIDKIYQQWNQALATKDMPALLALYAENIIIESPLIPHLLPIEKGVLVGKTALQEFIEVVLKCQPSKRQFHRTAYLTDGKRLMWEYPRKTPNGDQMDFVEVMDIENGLIQRHRVYWGWFGFDVMQRGEHHK